MNTSMDSVASNPVSIVEELYKDYAADVYNFLVYYTCDRNVAEDLLQDTFLHVLKSHATFAGRSTYKTWIFQIAKNAAIDWQRKAKKVAVSAWDSAKVPATTQGLEETILDKEEKMLIHSTIQQLPPNYRLVVLLRAMEGFNVAETCKILGWSESKVKTTYHRALKQLALYLEEKGVKKVVER